MSVMDIMLGVIIVVFTFVGIKRGIINELLGITGWIAAILLALKFCDRLAPRIAAAMPEVEQISLVVAFIALFAGIRLFFYILIFLFKKLLSSHAQSSMDKIGGGVLGILHGVLLACIFVIMLEFFHIGEKLRDVGSSSFLYPRFSQLSFSVLDGLARFIPQTKGLVDHVKQKVVMPAGLESVEGAAKGAAQGIEKSVEVIKGGTKELTPEEAKKLYEKERQRIQEAQKDLRR
jgi:membrane protein required for colicin V production